MCKKKKAYTFQLIKKEIHTLVNSHHLKVGCRSRASCSPLPQIVGFDGDQSSAMEAFEQI